MGSTLAELRARVIGEAGDNSTTPVLFTTASLVDGWVLDGYRQTSVERPRRMTYTFDLQVDVTRYAVPSDALLVRSLVVRDASDPNADVELDFVTEPWSAAGSTSYVVLTRIPSFYGSDTPTTVTMLYDALHTEPSTTDGSMPDSLEAAVVEYALSRAMRWVARKLVSGNLGVIEFTRMNYSEKGGASIAAIEKMSAAHLDEWRRICGMNEPAIAETAGDLDASVDRRRLPLTGLSVDPELGPTSVGDGSGDGRPTPGPIVR